MSTPASFRAVWPITDERAAFTELLSAALVEVPLLAAQAKCRVVGRGRFSIDLSVNVPGSGRITPTCLIYEAPAQPVEARAYHRRTTAA
jgi:hypothetical protein